MTPSTPVIIETARLRLRPSRDADLEPFAALNADPRVMEFFPKLLSREESDVRAARIRNDFDRDGYGLWAVEVPEIAAVHRVRRSVGDAVRGPFHALC